MAIRVPRNQAPVFFGGLTLFVIVLLGVLTIPLDIAEKKRVEAEYSPDMSIDDKAYVDIVSCEPKYTVMDKKRPALGVQDVICECQTVNNGKVLVAISHVYYINATRNFEGSKSVGKKGEYQTLYGSTESYDILSFPSPYRLHCRVSGSKSFGLDKELADAVILEMRYNNKGD